jgi:hypothetical protein
MIEKLIIDQPSDKSIEDYSVLTAEWLLKKSKESFLISIQN